MKEPVRARIRRAYVDAGLYFITAVVHDRRPLFASEAEIQRLRTTMREVKAIQPFTVRAYAFLPDHLHLMLRVGETTDISKVLHSIKRNYTLNYKRGRGLSKPVTLWQRGFWDHVIRDERDFRNHLNYVHYNPVKHGYCSRPEDYQHTSFHDYVRRGWYDVGWGHTEPNDIAAIAISEP